VHLRPLREREDRVLRLPACLLQSSVSSTFLRTTPHPYARGQKAHWYGEYIPLKGKTHAQLEKAFAKVVKRLGTQDQFYEGLLATRRSKDGVPVYGAATGT
jgi:hypothetical protein